MGRHVLLPGFLLAALLVLCGCSRFNGTRLEPVLGGDIDLVALGDRVAETLVSRPVPPLIPQQPDQPILVATLVNNDDLNDTSNFGRSFQNNITAGFVKRGYAVREIKLRRELLVQMYKGELMLTRDIQELAAATQRAQAVVVGTYTLANRVMYLSVRLVSPRNQAIRAVYEDKLYLDDNNLRLLGLKFKHGTGDDPINPVLPPSPSVLDTILY
ncbi:FlgO family outer membrane protein [Desulfobulbus elongatus]|uniref:FlgO family outer membrane protein n=1 Tax=Desulfobulbus elongatus TaxID=53332 RepID=UPI0012FB3609|nr:FlgO family outer membrane protein [Desulfobulbus elongatus]